MDEFAARRGVAILVDEVFSDYAFTTDSLRTQTFAGAAPVFHMSGLSKIAGLPQMKLGWILASGARHEESVERLEWIADTYLSVGTPVQLAVPELLKLSSGIQAQIRARTAANLNTLRAAVHESSLNVLNVEGGWCATLQLPRTRSEEEWVLALLRDRDVLTQPGFFYDFESEAFLVLSLLTAEDVFQEGASRIVAAVV